MAGQDPAKYFEELRTLFEDSTDKTNTNEKKTPRDPNEWLKLVRDKLYNMLCSPMKEEYLHEAFKWVANLCLMTGDLSWLNVGDEWTDKEAKMFSCIARLSLGEITILLPFVQRHLTCGEEVDLEDGKVMARPANSEEYERFGNHLVIIESIIKSLVENQTEEDDSNSLTKLLSSSELRSLLERLKEVMANICDYLELVHRYWANLTEKQDNFKMDAAEAALRIISVWLSEDPGSFEPQCKRFLIDLIIRNLLILDRQSKADLLITALHSICTSSEIISDELKKTNGHREALEKYLKHVEQNYKSDLEVDGKKRRAQKLFKLRCGLVKDLLKMNP